MYMGTCPHVQPYYPLFAYGEIGKIPDATVRVMSSQLTEMTRPHCRGYQLAPARLDLAAGRNRPGPGRPAGGRRHEVVGARSSGGTAEGPPARARSWYRLANRPVVQVASRTHPRARGLVSVRARTHMARAIDDRSTPPGSRVESSALAIPSGHWRAAAHALPGPCSAAARPPRLGTYGSSSANQLCSSLLLA